MNNINNELQPQSSPIISNKNIDSNHTNDNENNNDEDMNLVIAKQLFEAYCKYPIYTATDEMASILLSLSLSPIQQTHQLSITSTTTPTPHSTSTTPSTISISSLTMPSIIASFIELRSQYIGAIDATTNNNNNNTNNNQNSILNRFSTNDDAFNYSLFHAALLTNSPIIIDAVLPYINYDFTTFNIPHDQIELIKQMNVINNFYRDEIYPTNYILRVIVNATEKGHYQSILHLINNYQLSPTIPICDVSLYESYGCTNLLYYSRHNKNPQLIEYLLPLCFKSTNQRVLTESIFNIARYGHLDLIKQFNNEYNINFSQIQDRFNENILHYAVQSNNTELIDYLVEDIGLSVNERGVLQSTAEARKWDNVKHLLNKHNADITLVRDAFKHAARDPNITPDMINYIFTTFNTTKDEINDTTFYNSPLKSFTKNCNIIPLKHLIEKYNINPQCLFVDGRDGKGNSLLHLALDLPSQIKSTQLFAMVKYLVCELGLDVNKIGKRNRTPIELVVDCESKFNECRLPIFKLLLQHKAEIRDMDELIQRAVDNEHFTIIQHLIETHQPPIDVNNIKLLNQLPLLHYVIRMQPSIEFITYLLSLNTIDINESDCNGTTPIFHAMQTSHCEIDVVQLLIKNGATVTINDWLSIFGQLSSYSNSYKFFQCLDYFQDAFDFNVETFSLDGQQKSLYRFRTTPLLQYSLKQLTFRYSTIKYEKNWFNMVIIYRALIHYYKANVNDQDVTNNNNTIFHNLATNNHYELILFTLLHSHYKPNIYLVNKQGQTFLHILVSNCDQWIVGKSDEGDRKRYQQIIRAKLDGIQRINDNDFKLMMNLMTDMTILKRY